MLQLPDSLAHWRAGGTLLKALGHQVFVRAQGGGPTLLCIHGFPSSSYDFHSVWPGLLRDWQCIAVDMLGFGDSDKPAGHRYRIAEQAALLAEVLSALGVRDFHVLAHDYGVSVGQEILACHQEGTGFRGLQSMCFLNGGLFPEAHRPLFVQKLLASRVGPLLAPILGRGAYARALRRVFGPHTQPSGSEIDALWSLFSKSGGRAALPRLLAYMRERVEFRERWVGALLHSQIPLGMICGALDPISGAHLAEYARSLLPQLSVTLLEQVGHYPQLEDPVGVLAAYRGFRQVDGPALAAR